MSKPVVVIGMLGPSLDAGKGPDRWDKWRPTVALCQQPDLEIARYELLHQRAFTTLAEAVATDITRVSPETEVRRHVIELDDAWDFERVYAALSDFAAAERWKPEREDYLVHITTGTHVVQICLFLLVETREIPARLIQASPPRRGVDPAGSHAIIDLDLSRYDRLASRFRARTQEARSFLKAGIATRSDAFNRLIERLEQVAVASRDPILLLGPTGAGKSVLARRIYELRRARNVALGAFVEVNCATLRGDGAMSTLFGHVKGSFTGALRDRPGLLRAADDGVLFLDEIGELGLDEQAMLLRAIEEGVFLPLGADTPVRSRFQLLSGTNRDLGARVAEGRFREDLLARIHLWTFRLPGLAERPEDIEPNLDFELDRVSRALGRRVSISREARARYVAFATSAAATWPGNFRDLAASMTRMATLAEGSRIDMEMVDEEIARLEAAWGGLGAERAREAPRALARPPRRADLVDELLGRAASSIDPFDRAQLDYVLHVCRASPTLSHAGRALFAESRKRKSSGNDADRLRKYLARFGLDLRRIRKEA